MYVCLYLYVIYYGMCVCVRVCLSTSLFVNLTVCRSADALKFFSKLSSVLLVCLAGFASVCFSPRSSSSMSACAVGIRKNIALGSFLVSVEIELSCLNNTELCATNATCTNKNGSFECECLEGFTGNGSVCKGQFLCRKCSSL